MEALDPVVLARLQFAANITFHILFPTISIAMGWFLLFFKTRFVATGAQYWMNAYQFWVKIFALTFALGVVSGITGVGGLIGQNTAAIGGNTNIDNSYASGNVTGSSGSVGGLVGANQAITASAASSLPCEKAAPVVKGYCCLLGHCTIVSKRVIFAPPTSSL
jgi:hypothetical protein